MIISRIEIIGDNKEPAAIQFTKGLNSIVGATNTGKSYICECIQFIMGAAKAPKKIEESHGYDTLKVHFEEDDGSQFTLHRELKDKSDIIVEQNGHHSTYYPNKKAKNNISDFFLTKWNLSNMVLAKGLKNLTHSSLTLRIFEKIFLADEERIISKKSPLGNGSPLDTTLEWSLLKTLLTGEDDSEIQDYKEHRVSKQKLKYKIEQLEEFTNNFIPSIPTSSISEKELLSRIVWLEKNLHNEQAYLESYLSENNDLIEKRRSTREAILELQAEINEEKTSIERFNLLLQKYKSDLERLEANNEAIEYLAKHQASLCPTCGNKLPNHEAIKDDQVLRSNQAEHHKTLLKYNDLKSAIDEFQTNKTNLELSLKTQQSHLSVQNEALKKNLIPKIKTHTENVKSLMLEKTECEKTISNFHTRAKISKEINSLQSEHDRILLKYEIEDFPDELNTLTNEISEILTRWGFPQANQIVFDKKERDIIVDGTPRAHFGKGYRAISFASVLVALMNILTKKNRHPGFLIMDSPLTTYKQGDEKPLGEETEQENISNNLIYAFYRDLCDFYKDKQIIIFDNQEPDDDLIEEMSYTHFSGNTSIGRAGFFPS